MDDLIPLTDFDKRFFPEISQEEKINFILHSNSFERIVMKYEEIEAQLLIPTKIKPAVKGQQRALDWIIELASNPDLLPPANSITPINFDKKFNWFSYLIKTYCLISRKKAKNFSILLTTQQYQNLVFIDQMIKRSEIGLCPLPIK
jgi:hypothetical protein